MKNLLRNKLAATDVKAIDLPSEVETDDRHHVRLGWWIVLLGVGGFFLWAILAPLDQGVPVQGTVMVSTNRKAVQHQAGGTIEAILVREGDAVRFWSG